MIHSNLRRLCAACPLLLLAPLNLSGPMQAQAVSFAGVQIVAGTGLKLNAPNGSQGIAADRAGNLFVADTGNNRVVKFPAGGAAQSTVGSGLSAPAAVAVDAAGDVFIADTGNVRVVEIPAGNGAQTTLASAMTDPIGVAVDANGDVYIADYGNGLLEIPSGGKLELLSAYDEEYINSVAVDGKGDIFVSSTRTWDGIIYAPGSSAKEIVPASCQSWDCLTTVSSYPSIQGVAVDASGNVYVAQLNGVQEYTGGKDVGTIGTGIGVAAGVAVDPMGDVFIADTANNDVAEVQRVSVNFGNLALGAAGETLTLNYDISASGTLGTQNVLTLGATNSDFTLSSGSTCTGSVTSGKTCAVSVTFTPTAAGLRRGAVQLTGAEGNIATTMLYGTALGPQIAFGPGVQTTISSSLGLAGADGVAVDGKGDIIIADTFNNRVVNVPPKGALTTIGTGLCEPAGVAVDGAGDVFIADYCNSRVVEVPTGGAAQVTVGSGFNGPKDVAVDGAGDVFVADTLNNRVVEVAAGGAQSTLNVSAGGVALNSPTGVAVNAEGDVVIADTGNNRVVEVEPNGLQTTVGSGFNQPTGVAVDGAGSGAKSQPGDVYVADYGNQRVVEIPAGNNPNFPQFTIGTGYVGPHGVAVDSAGDLFVADRDDTRAFEFQLSAPGSLTFPTWTPVKQVDSTDGSMAVSVENIGNEALTFATVSYPANFPAHPPEQGLGCDNGLQLEPGQDCAVSVEFDPASVGANNGSIVLTDNALGTTNATQSISASGTGLYDTQTITFSPTVTSYPYTAGSFPLSATASSNLAVSFASMTASICTVSGTTATILSTGGCTIQATQAGNSIYSAATAVSVTFTIKPGPQVITFNPAVTTYSYAAHSFPLSATATSGLAVSFASTTPPVCKVSGATATILAGGICTIQATQSGNNDYSPATPVPVSFTITPVGQTIDITAIKLPEYAASKLTLSATATSKLPVSFASKTTKVCTVSGDTAQLLIEGTCTIVASQAGNSTYTAATAKKSFPVSLASQKIHFAPIPTQYAGTTLKLTATASSKLPVKYTSETLSVCTISIVKGESIANLLTAGTCTIKASQRGNDVYAAAKAVPESFQVLKKK